MVRLKFLPLLLAAVCTVPHVASSDEEGPQCAQHCQCDYSQMFGARMKCSKITPTQYFQNLVVSFNLERNESDPAEPLELSKNFFAELGNNFKHIDSMLIEVDVSSIDVDAFQGLDNLATLNISNNGLTYIHPDTFLNVKSLRRLAITRNPLTFGEIVFNSLRLAELDLSFCQIRELPENAFMNLTELDYLNLESNLIDTINPKTFEPLSSLEELNLANNKLRILSPDSFLKNKALNHLTLSHNPLSSIENVHITGIKVLYLQHCNLTELNAMSFSNHTNLVHLNLSGNSISKVSPDTFTKLEHLSYLDISNNNLGPLDSKLFSGNQKLETLSLRDNPSMSLWPEGGFQGQFAHLHLLDISNTGIQSLALGNLKPMSKLAQLDLSRNGLTGIEKDALPQSIVFLSLANNKIVSINDIHLTKQLELKQLFLQGNKIKYLQPDNFENLQHLVKLDLSSCDIENIWLNNQTGDKKITKLQQLDISNNKLTKITPDDLGVFNNLNMLNLKGNPLACDEDLDILINYLHNSSIDPVQTINVGTIDQHYVRFEWENIREVNCAGTQEPQQKPKEKLVQPISVSKQPTFPPKSESIDNKNQKSTPIYEEEYEDIIRDDADYDYESNNDETTRMPYHKQAVPPNIVEIPNTSPVVVAFLSTLIMTLIIILLLVLVTTICRHKLINRMEKWKRPYLNRSSSYTKILPSNEHQNVATTPIVRIKPRLGSSIEA